MPTYDYSCSGCGHRFEKFEGMADDGPKPCPRCGKKKARRMLGVGAGIIFKGSGFYVTDYKRPKAAEPEKASGGEKKKTVRREKKEEPKK
jgi:putative FmdB family regulatory protein